MYHNNINKIEGTQKEFFHFILGGKILVYNLSLKHFNY